MMIAYKSDRKTLCIFGCRQRVNNGRFHLTQREFIEADKRVLLKSQMECT